MARYSRRRGYRRPYSVSFRFGRQKRRFRRQNAGALEQRDIGRFIVKVNATDSMAIAQGQATTTKVLNPLHLLEISPLFVNFKTVFDQVKINAVKVRLVPTAIGVVEGSYMQTVIAWDRNGEGAISWNKAISYGSAKTNYVGPGTKTVMTHFIAAETIGEKTQYLPTDEIVGDHNFAWQPMLVVGIQSPVNTTAANQYFLNYAIEFAFDCTFRGTRLM